MNVLARQELTLLQEVEKLKAAVDEELERQSTGAIWGKPALQILQLPGVHAVGTFQVETALTFFDFFFINRFCCFMLVDN